MTARPTASILVVQSALRVMSMTKVEAGVVGRVDGGVAPPSPGPDRHDVRGTGWLAISDWFTKARLGRDLLCVSPTFLPVLRSSRDRAGSPGWSAPWSQRTTDWAVWPPHAVGPGTCSGDEPRSPPCTDALQASPLSCS